MSVEYAIPSRGRAESLPRRTLTTLSRLGVDRARVRVYVAADELDAYRHALDAAGYGAVELVRGARGMAAQRHAILDAYPAGTRLVQIDDDVADVVVRRDARTLDPVEPGEWAQEVEQAFRWCQRNGARLWGVYPVANAMFMRPRVRADLTYICGDLYGCITDGDAASPLRPTLDDKEDFERSLQCYRADGLVVRLEYLATKTRYYDAPGGMQTDGLRTEARIRASADALVARYPDLATLNLTKRSGHAEVRLRDRVLGLHVLARR